MLRHGLLRPFRLAAVLAALLAAPPPAVAQEGPPSRAGSVPASRCKLGQIAELKITVERNRPLLLGKVNGQPVRMLFDTGASSTLMLTGAARRLGVPLSEEPDYRVFGAGGTSAVFSALLKTWDIESVQRKDFRMMVTGQGAGSDVDIILGQDFFAPFDLELDMRHGVIRLLKITGCKAEDLPYWAKGAYSQADLRVERTGKLELQPKLNGRTVMAMLDTGASRSVGTPAGRRSRRGEAGGDGRARAGHRRRDATEQPRRAGHLPARRRDHPQHAAALRGPLRRNVPHLHRLAHRGGDHADRDAAGR